MQILCVQSVVIILPTISEALDIPASPQDLVVSLYHISLACLTIFWGRTADVYGHRLIFPQWMNVGMAGISFAIALVFLKGIGKS